MTRHAIIVLAAFFLAAGARGQETKPVSFEKDVLPILKTKCFDCHQGGVKDKRGRIEEPDGGLALNGKMGILRGGDSGRAVTPWKSDKSLLFIRCTLDEDHPDVMPAAGDMLTKDELGSLKRWIDEGAEFGAWVGVSAKAAPAKKPAKESAVGRRWRELASGLAPLGRSTVDRAGFPGRIDPIFEGSPLLRVTIHGVQSKIDVKTIAALAPLAGHIAQLKLGGAEVSDAAMSTIARMKRLDELDLSRTKVTAKGLKKIAELPALRVLNLHHTEVGAKAAESIAAMPKLEKVYLWNAGFDAKALEELGGRRANLKVIGAPTMPLPPRPRENDNNRRRRR